MKLREPGIYNDWKAKNDDPYGAACFIYAEHWANRIEARLANGESLADVAEDCSREADREPGMGITGFMYGMAVSILSKCWEHGEELRRWHNLKTQIKNEGEKANENGGVLNPALLCIGEKAS